MRDIQRRNLLKAGVAATLAGGLPGFARAEDQSTLAGAGRDSIERYLGLQETALREDATAGALLSGKAPRKPVDLCDRILMWNEISLATNALDYVRPSIVGGLFHQQFGPHKSSRAMAVVALAVFEAVNARDCKFKSYANFTAGQTDWSMDAAIAQASHDALVHLYPPQASQLDAILADDMTQVHGTTAQVVAGRSTGSAAVAAVLTRLGSDNTTLPEPSIPADYQPSHAAGAWDVDPVSNIMVALGGNWSKVTPFTFSDATQFRPPAPPSLTDPVYFAAYQKTLAFGGDPLMGTPSARTTQETFLTKFWSYDGTPGLCAPPRLFNQIARQLILSHGVSGPGMLARFLAMINIGMADAAVSAWEAKYFYKVWRPVTAIRFPGAPNQNLTWYPLGAQATNTNGPNITPPFPAYPSGHATFGGALFEILRSYMPDSTSFSFVSDEFNGKNKDVYGYIRAKQPAHFKSLSDAEQSCAESRIWGGVHWQFDGDQGIIQGRRIAQQVMSQFAPSA